jgi:phospholipid/cholesterol/gamma-HCH transport system substrate-binding protein
MKRRDEVLVGLLLIVAVTVGVAGTVWLARGGLSSGYEMYVRFPWGAGLKNGQPVLLAGVNIGFVKAVKLDPNGTLVVTLAINNEYQVPEGTTAAVAPNGIFGDQLIALQPERAVTTYMAKGDTIPTSKGTPTTGELLAKGDSIAKDVEALTGALRTEFVDGGGIANLRQVTADMAKLVTQLGTIAEAQSVELTRTQRQLRSTLAAIDSGVVDSTLRAFQASSANVAAVTEELRHAQTQVRSILEKLDNGTGTAGKLLNDPSVYARLDTLLLRLDSLAADVKANPRRYINLRVF